MIMVQLHTLTQAGMDQAADELGLEPQQYAELVGVFLTRTADGIRELEAAIESHDKDAAQRAVHSIKGTALNMRLSMVSEPSIALEAAIKTCDNGTCPERLHQLKTGFAQLVSEAKKLGIEG